MARDKTCRAPGCRIPARRCELDHTRRFPDGPTADTNLGCGCRHHHRKKHQTDWQVEQLPDNTFSWTSPTGHTYRVPPEPLPRPPTTRPAAATTTGRTRPGSGNPTPSNLPTRAQHPLDYAEVAGTARDPALCADDAEYILCALWSADGRPQPPCALQLRLRFASRLELNLI